MIGKKVLIQQNIEGNTCEPFIGITGIVVPPFRRGCKRKDWWGVILDKHTIYGSKFNFHVNELKIISDEEYSELNS